MARCLRVFHSPVERGAVALRGETFAYVAVVHRARIGHRIELFDGEGHTAIGTFVRFESDAAHVEITEIVASSLALRPVRLVQCLSKGDKIDETLRDACELGVKHVVVAEAARSVRKLDEAGGTKLRERLSRVAAEAARQALSPHVATVSGPAPLATAFGDGVEPLRLVLDPTGAAPFFDALSAAPARAPIHGLRSRAEPLRRAELGLEQPAVKGGVDAGTDTSQPSRGKGAGLLYPGTSPFGAGRDADD